MTTQAQGIASSSGDTRSSMQLSHSRVSSHGLPPLERLTTRSPSTSTQRDPPLPPAPLQVPTPLPADETAVGPPAPPNIHWEQIIPGAGAGGPSRRITVLRRALIFLGYSGPDAKVRREFMSLCWNLAFGGAQIIIIITLLAFSAHHQSPTVPGLSEWNACARPLGVWNSIWLFRVALGMGLSYWGWHRERTVRQLQASRNRLRDPESGGMRPPNATSLNSNGFPLNGNVAHDGNVSPGNDNTSIESPIQLPYSKLYARLSLLVSFLSLAWFLTAHILEYTSVKTCRFAAPHLWWLTFGILCILYLMMLEIFLLGLLVFILGPVIYLFWNIVLLCLGRHPLQNPHYIKPEIGKLPKSVVEQIPLVLFIPAPPEGESGPDSSSPISKPSPTYAYPPNAPAPVRPRRRFAFFRHKRTKSATGGAGSENEKAAAHEPHSYEDMWEQGEYPFVKLEGNRAACAICLMDFEEPKRVGGEVSHSDSVDHEHEPKPDATPQEIAVEAVSEEERHSLRLDDAGEGPQPLRLLSCGHAFHKTCLDPWLIDVSGRCPTCQRPVEVPAAPGKKAKRARRAANNGA